MDFTAERSLRNRDGNGAMDVRALPLEKGVFFDVQHDVEVACRSPEGASFAVSREANARAIFNAGGNLGFDGALPENAAIALTFRARVGNDGTRALAGWAGARDREEFLLVADLAFTLAGAAADRSFSGRSACSVAGLAGLMAAHRDLSVRPKDCLFKFEGQVFAQIGTALCTRTAAPAAPAAHIAESEELAENFTEVLEGIGIKATARAATSDTCVPKAVVHRTLLGVDENGIRLGALLELLFGIRVVRIAIGVVLECELAVGTLDLHLG